MTCNRSSAMVLHISCRHLYCLTLNPKEIACWEHLHLINEFVSTVIGASNTTEVLIATYTPLQTMGECMTEYIKGSGNCPMNHFCLLQLLTFMSTNYWYYFLWHTTGPMFDSVLLVLPLTNTYPF